MAVTIGIGLIASLVPAGGGTAVSAIGVAGMLAAFDVPRPAAAAAVVIYALVRSYLPAFPGFLATNDLIRKGLL